jgi:uridylate kinase
MLKYKRVLLKLSGEALAGERTDAFDPAIVKAVAGDIGEVRAMGAEVAVVIGAGNIFRGSMAEQVGIDRITGDAMGMLATVMNALAVKSVLDSIGVPAEVLNATAMPGIAEFYTIQGARRLLEQGKVVIAAGGTGHPFFTTDTAAALRALELGAQVLLKATKVNGVYSSDPEKDRNAKKYDTITYMDVITKGLRVMDLTAVSLCRDNGMPLIVFNLFDKGALAGAVAGDQVGTTIS